MTHAVDLVKDTMETLHTESNSLAPRSATDAESECAVDGVGEFRAQQVTC